MCMIKTDPLVKYHSKLMFKIMERFGLSLLNLDLRYLKKHAVILVPRKLVGTPILAVFRKNEA